MISHFKAVSIYRFFRYTYWGLLLRWAYDTWVSKYLLEKKKKSEVEDLVEYRNIWLGITMIDSPPYLFTCNIKGYTAGGKSRILYILFFIYSYLSLYNLVFRRFFMPKAKSHRGKLLFAYFLVWEVKYQLST